MQSSQLAPLSHLTPMLRTLPAFLASIRARYVSSRLSLPGLGEWIRTQSKYASALSVRERSSERVADS